MAAVLRRISMTTDSDGCGGELVATSVWQRSLGVSRVTIWRWSRARWVRLIRVGQRSFITRAEIARFEARAARGEFRHLNPDDITVALKDSDFPWDNGPASEEGDKAP